MANVAVGEPISSTDYSSLANTIDNFLSLPFKEPILPILIGG